MGGEEQQGEGGGAPHADVAHQPQVGEQHEGHHQQGHIFAVEHGGHGGADGDGQRPSGSGEIVLVEEEEQRREEEQRGVGGGDEAIDDQHCHRGGDDAKLQGGAWSVARLLIQRLPDQPEGAGVQQGGAEAHAEVAAEEETAAVGEQRHHRRMVVIAPVEESPVESVVGLVGVDFGEQGRQQVGADPEGQDTEKDAFLFLHGGKNSVFYGLRVGGCGKNV